jgi:signal recognition particle receptor subunit beta
MAAIENEHLVVNVVFTGPPLAGKTQSVRALMPLLKGRGTEQKVLSPGDWRGRTAFFDWAVYEGGAYDGKSIQCRIISTPGQVALSDRREMLLRSADAVILVIDSQAEALERAVHCYEEMAPWLAESSRDVPVRVVLQCNKQDLPGSLSAEELSRRLNIPCGKDFYPTSASTGKGLRAAFVAGVRNAVERARSLVARGLVLDAPEIASGEELFERMRREVAPIGSAYPAPVGSVRPALSTSAVSPPVSTPAGAISTPVAPAPASRPGAMARPGSERPSSSRGTGRNKADSARPSGRSSSKAPASGSAASGGATSRSAPPGGASSSSGSSRGASSGRSRPAPKGGSASIPFGTSKSKSNSGFYPATSTRPSSNPERSSTTHPPLPPDHPFAPTRPSTRRPGAGSSRPSSSAVPGAGGAIPRPKSSDSAAPASVDDKARSTRQGRPSPTTPPAGRTTPATGVPAAPPLRSGRAGGAKAPTPSGEAIAARSSADATSGTAPARGDIRQSLTALAARAAAEVATARAPAPIESPPASAAALVVPAASPGSAPPSSATASAPASSARRAIIPPHSEPGALALESGREPAPFAPANPLAASSPHPKGWLDPAGATARSWRPGQGPRPAILPSSAYHAVLPAELEARRELLATAATAAAAEAERRSRAPRADAASGAARRDVQAKRSPPAPAPEARSGLSGAGASTRSGLPSAGTASHASARPFAAGGPRPAVMPASAYVAALAVRAQQPGIAADDTSSATAAQTVGEYVAPEPARERATRPSASLPAATARGAATAPSGTPHSRPAVMPASAYFASLEAGSTADADVSSSAAEPAHGMGSAAAASARASAARQTSEPAPSASPTAPRGRAGRPAVMPASSYFASLAARGAVPSAESDGSREANGAVSGDAGAGTAWQAPAADAVVPEATLPQSMRVEPSASEATAANTPRARARRAVIPANAWRAALAAGDEMPTRAQPAPAASTPAASALSGAPVDVRPAPSIDDDPVDSGWPEAGEVLSTPPPFSSPVPGASVKSRRPAVMPASAWRTLVERGELPDDRVEAARNPSAALAAGTFSPAATDDVAGSGAGDVYDEWPAQPSEGQRRDARGVARSLRLLRGGTSNRRSDEPRAPSARPSLTLLQRPAVMPASAWQQSQATPLPAGGPGAAPRQGSLRPAVMPASAWRAAVEAAAEQARSTVAASADALAHLGGAATEANTSAAVGAAAAAAEGLPAEDAAGSGATDRAAVDPAADSAATAPPQATTGDRASEDEPANGTSHPASLDTGGSLEADAALQAANDGAPADSPALPAIDDAGAGSSSTGLDGAGPLHDAGDASASAPPTQPSEGRAANDMPTLAPPSDLLLSTERPTIVAGALAEPAAAAARSAPAEFADPATFGLESSRLVESNIDPSIDSHPASSDDSNESFRIPETPPGLQAFIAKARLSTPPPPAPPPSDDVIPSLAPSPSPAEMEAAAMGHDPQEPPEFAGPRMPGHARSPRAVWRRSTWRTLEMHINSDATALEDARGRWIGELAPGWYARTLRSAPDARSARRAFAEEVLRERRLGVYLSRPRCVALTEEADRFWIWQAACRVPTLAAVLGRRLAARESPSAMAEALLDASLAFVEARQRFIQARVPLPLSLHALSVQDDKLVYSGLLPDPGAAFIHPPSDGHIAFEDALRKKWPGAPGDGSAVFAELSSKAAGRLPEPILAIIRSVVGESFIETSTNEVSG